MFADHNVTVAGGLAVGVDLVSDVHAFAIFLDAMLAPKTTFQSIGLGVAYRF